MLARIILAIFSMIFFVAAAPVPSAGSNLLATAEAIVSRNNPAPEPVSEEVNIRSPGGAYGSQGAQGTGLFKSSGRKSPSGAQRRSPGGAYGSQGAQGTGLFKSSGRKSPSGVQRRSPGGAYGSQGAQGTGLFKSSGRKGPSGVQVR